MIALTQRVEIIEHINERRDAVSQEWALFAEACGFIPVFLPNRLPVVKELLEALPIEGFILTGGNDLAAYGGDAAERDEVEHYLLQVSIETNVPLIGVCRGMQILLDQFGTPMQKVAGHVGKEHLLDSGTMVNSYHNWGAIQCHEPLQPIFWAEDHVLEAVRHENFSWIQGIMWHPERYSPFRESDLQMFREGLRL